MLLAAATLVVAWIIVFSQLSLWSPLGGGTLPTVRLLNSRGFAAVADVPAPHSPYFAMDTLARATHGEMEDWFCSEVMALAARADQRTVAGELADVVVWVRTVDIGSFARVVLPAIEASGLNVTLYSGDGYKSVPSDIDAGAVASILDCEGVRAWHAQNLDRSTLLGGGSDKITPLPIGFDFHSATVPYAVAQLWRAYNKYLGGRWHWSSSAFARTAQPIDRLSRARASAQSGADRRPSVWSDAHLKSYPRRFGDPRGDLREEIERRCDDTGAVVQCGSLAFANERVPQDDLWRMYGTYRYVVTAPGMGLDCHRTWEILFLGAVPVTVSSPLDELYEALDLPVLVLQSWQELWDQDLLDRRWREDFKDRRWSTITFNTLKTWAERPPGRPRVVQVLHGRAGD